MRTLLSIIGILTLVSCGFGREPNPDNALSHSAAPTMHTARMVLRVLEDRGTEKKLGIVVQNPGRVPIQSVRSWVRFDPEAADISDLAIEQGDLVLFAPGERMINQAEGFVQIGAAARTPIRDDVFTVASFTVRGTPVLTFYDWRPEGDGHSALLSLQEGDVTNILASPPSIEVQ